MNKKQLAIQLSKLKQLENLNIHLEQYQTDSEFAADFLYSAFDFDVISGKTVADFGCGNGILGLGALILGAKKVYFLDLDKKFIEVLEENIKLLKIKESNYKIINSDVSEFDEKVDIVIMNPPFGVQNRKADKEFLLVAMKKANSIFSIHKIESKKFIESLCNENKFKVIKIIFKKLLLKKTYKFHSKKEYSVDVGLWLLFKEK